MAHRDSDNDNRALRARMAAHVLHAQVSDEAEHTAPARAAFLSRFEREVDPDGVLDPDERARRADHAKRPISSDFPLLRGRHEPTKSAARKRPLRMKATRHDAASHESSTSACGEGMVRLSHSP
jgi:hypothetical protein